MLDSSWGLLLRVLPSLPFNILTRRLCHFPRRMGSSIARERSPLRDLFTYISLLQISPLEGPGQFFCLPGRWCLFRHLPVVVAFLLHCRYHKGCLAFLSVAWETRFDLAFWNKLLAQACVLKNCGSWWLKFCSLHMWSILPVQAFLGYEPLQPLASFPL